LESDPAACRVVATVVGGEVAYGLPEIEAEAPRV